MHVISSCWNVNIWQTTWKYLGILLFSARSDSKHVYGTNTMNLYIIKRKNEKLLRPGQARKRSTARQLGWVDFT